jgi:hypothetical protein
MGLNAQLQFAIVFMTTVLILPTASSVHAQVVKVAPKSIRPEVGTGSLSVSAAPSMVSFNLTPGQITAGNSPVSITTTWSGSTVGSTMSLYGYFVSSTAALTGTTNSVPIPSSAVFGQMTTGLPTSFSPFTQTNPVGGAAASLTLFSQAITGSGAGSRTDALNLTIDLTNLPQLPAGTYTGTLVIQAQVL